MSGVGGRCGRYDEKRFEGHKTRFTAESGRVVMYGEYCALKLMIRYGNKSQSQGWNTTSPWNGKEVHECGITKSLDSMIGCIDVFRMESVLKPINNDSYYNHMTGS